MTAATDPEPARSFTDTLLGERPTEARAMVTSLLDGGFSPREIYMAVLAPSLEEVGARWQLGRASVAQEHLATAVVSSIMATLAPKLYDPPAVGRRIILASTDGELHDVGLRMVADFLEGDGWEVTFLGAATPAADLAALVRGARPHAVGLSTSLTTHLAAAGEAIAALRSLDRVPYIVVGGRAHAADPDAWRRIGADAHAAGADEASTLLREHTFDD